VSNRESEFLEPLQGYWGDRFQQARGADRIFERSYPGAWAPSLTAGLGPGLYVARKTAVAHGGTLDFDLERMGAKALNSAAFYCRRKVSLAGCYAPRSAKR
jgi:hypothetical protein